MNYPNLATLPKEEQEKIEREKNAYFLLKTKKRQEIIDHLDTLPELERGLMVETLNLIKGVRR